ncbi:hypothetical protein VNI00_015503 [Paramarasmius palmivorus]|uniref:Uncharacterized protein n=1 Tax=Paramarasmius palmivorus TaxID=297713 RepID=A0AAW0BKU9_9AGAR
MVFKLLNSSRSCARFSRLRQNFIINNAEALKFEYVLNLPHRLKLLRRECDIKASSVRNGLRQHVRNGVDADHGMTLEAFLRHTVPCMHIQGVYPSEVVTFKVVLLRRFVVDNPHIVWADEDVDNGQADGEPAKKWKKTTRAVGGRIAKGKDFWTLFDQYLTEKVNELGKKINAPEWKKLLTQLSAEDAAGFPGRRTAGEVKKDQSTAAPIPLLQPGMQVIQPAGMQPHAPCSACYPN